MSEPESLTRRNYLTDLGGVTEVAEILNVSPQRVYQLLDVSGFPEPVAELSAGRVWDLDDIREWNAGRRRRPGRPPGKRLGDRFLLMDRIGSGGFADVFRAEDLDEGEIVAVKILKNWEPENTRRFHRELELLTSIAHPNVVPVLAYGSRDEETHWYAMPLAKSSLEDELPTLGRGNDAEPRILEIMLQMGNGLAHLHHGIDVPIYHRDLCPANVLQMSNGEWALSDFGLAREEVRRSTATRSSIHWGWAAYAAPEQLESGLREAGQPADIYAAGRVLLAMVLGKTLIPQDEAPENHKLRQVIRRATERDPTRRYDSIEEMLDAVQSILTRPGDRWENPEARARRLFEEMADPSTKTLKELQTAILDDDRQERTTSRILAEAMARLERKHIKALWGADSDAFVHMLRRWGETVQGGSDFNFSYCDVLANFGKRVVSATDDDEVVATVITSLIELGANHNRWHVRSIVIDLLQQIQDPKRAQVAVEAIRRTVPSAVEWTLTDFAVRSLHPIIHKGVVEGNR